MTLNQGENPNIDGDAIATESEVKKWKRRSMIFSVALFVIGLLIPSPLVLI